MWYVVVIVETYECQTCDDTVLVLTHDHSRSSHTHT